MVMLKEGETNQYQNKFQQLKWREKGKQQDHVKDGEMTLKGI
jgi:hypothetical protein